MDEIITISEQFGEGFNLKESDLRRIIEIIVKYLSKNHQDQIILTYTTELSNGLNISTSNFEEIFKIENDNNKSIKHLKIKGSTIFEGREIELVFNNTKHYKDAPPSIKYFIKG